MNIQLTVFWAVTLGGDVVEYQHFGGPCCLHLEDEVTHFTSSKALVSYHIIIWHHNPEDDLNVRVTVFNFMYHG
jgi:hypothetical protein